MRVCRIGTLSALVGIIVIFAAVLPAAAQDRAAVAQSSITVAGRQVSEGAYMISLEAQLSHPGTFDGALIFAEPSHTLLLVVAAGDTPAFLAGNEEPLVSVQGRLSESAPQVKVPYEVAGDTRIVVQLVTGGERVTVSDARINVAAFQFTSTFGVPGPGPDMPIKNHCVTCGSCGKMCMDCEGPRFSANCVTCEIKCGW